MHMFTNLLAGAEIPILRCCISCVAPGFYYCESLVIDGLLLAGENI